MTDCRTVQQDIDALLAGEHGHAAAEEAHRHLANCPACRAYLSDVRTLRETLASAGPDAMPGAIRRRLLHRQRRAWQAGTGVAAALALVTVLATSLWQGGDAPEGNPSEDWREVTVNLRLDSREALSQVRIRLELPEGVVVDGHPNRTTIAWTDDLEAGDNRLRVPLLLRGEPTGELIARLEHQGRSRELRLAPDELTRLVRQEHD